jgi:hypothetical protein
MRNTFFALATVALAAASTQAFAQDASSDQIPLGEYHFSYQTQVNYGGDVPLNVQTDKRPIGEGLVRSDSHKTGSGSSDNPTPDRRPFGL